MNACPLFSAQLEAAGFQQASVHRSDDTRVAVYLHPTGWYASVAAYHVASHDGGVYSHWTISRPNGSGQFAMGHEQTHLDCALREIKGGAR